MTNLKLSMSPSASRVDRLDVRRPQPGSWPIRQTHQWLLVVLLIFICGPALYAADIPSLVRAAKPAVVQLLVYDQDGELVASGTGFFISPDGKLLTNSHVLEGKVYSFEAKTITGRIYSNWRILTVPQKHNHPTEQA